MMIEIGQKVRFEPLREIKGFGAENNRGKMVTGIVIEINEPNKWFSVQYNFGGVKLRESFKFCEIGKTVKLCGK